MACVVISPHRAQCGQLRRALESESASKMVDVVDTVDRIQVSQIGSRYLHNIRPCLTHCPPHPTPHCSPL